jgi:hypothetical protein
MDNESSSANTTNQSGPVVGRVTVFIGTTNNSGGFEFWHEPFIQTNRLPTGTTQGDWDSCVVRFGDLVANSAEDARAGTVQTQAQLEQEVLVWVANATRDALGSFGIDWNPTVVKMMPEHDADALLKLIGANSLVT